MEFSAIDLRHPKFPARIKSGTKFYPLPPDVQDFGKTWTNLIVSGIQPSALELGWRQSVCADVYMAMKERIADKSMMESQAVFFTEDFVFVENFKCWKTMDGHKTCLLQMKNILNRYAGAYVPNLDASGLFYCLFFPLKFMDFFAFYFSLFQFAFSNWTH